MIFSGTRFINNIWIWSMYLCLNYLSLLIGISFCLKFFSGDCVFFSWFNVLESIADMIIGFTLNNQLKSIYVYVIVWIISAGSSQQHFWIT